MAYTTGYKGKQDQVDQVLDNESDGPCVYAFSAKIQQGQESVVDDPNEQGSDDGQQDESETIVQPIYEPSDQGVDVLPVRDGG